MKKQFILDEIRRTAQSNGGMPLGEQRFTKETGIRMADWYTNPWVRWSDALKEAGFAPNKYNQAYPEEYLIEKLIELMRELDPPRFPVSGDFRLKSRGNPDFPGENAFRRLGQKRELVTKVISYCDSTGGLEDIIELCRSVPKVLPSAETSPPEGEHGFVYLLRSGRHYKIGRTNSAGRRERELAIQLPERATLVHEIRTDDPAGIELYWHRRFHGKRKNGEWFALEQGDVLAFKRRKFM